MALIKCPECNADISDKAVECPKCGCPLEVKTNKKSRKSINKKTICIVAIALVVIILAVVLLLRPDKSGLYKGYKWGTSYEEIKNKLGKDVIVSDDKSKLNIVIDKYDNKEGVTQEIAFLFNDEKLEKVSLYIINKESSEYADSVLIEEIVAEYDKLYERITDSNYSWNAEQAEIKLSYLIDGLIVVSHSQK